MRRSSSPPKPHEANVAVKHAKRHRAGTSGNRESIAELAMAAGLSPTAFGAAELTVQQLAVDARAAGKSAHDRGLEKRGSVMKVNKHGMLVIQRRDGEVQELRKVAEPTFVRRGTVLKRRSNKPDPATTR
jgi:hypothetical protein